MAFIRKEILAAAALLTALTACAPSQASSTSRDARVQPEYDRDGRLTKLTYDRDGDGKIDTWGFMDGSRVVRVEIDENGDGQPDTWEYHTGAASPQNSAGGVDPTVTRIERAGRFDGTISRREYFEAGVLVRVEEDTDHDGVVDKWETYTNGTLATMSLDTQARGKPDRRLVYGVDGSLIRIEADPEGTGTFRPLPQ